MIYGSSKTIDSIVNLLTGNDDLIRRVDNKHCIEFHIVENAEVIRFTKNNNLKKGELCVYNEQGNYNSEISFVKGLNLVINKRKSRNIK